MATGVSQSPAQPLANGTSLSPSPAEQEELYDQLLKLRDVVLEGKHTHLKLPPSAVEQLRASLIAFSAPPGSSQNGAITNGQAFETNKQQPSQSSTLSLAQYARLPGLQNAASPTVNGGLPHSTTIPSTAAQLDPIFLQKSDHLVRAETQLKRQRIERDLYAQVEQRKQQSSRDKDSGIDAPSRIDIDLVLLSAMGRVKHVSGLKAAPVAGSAASSSFDENDYYSSLVQSAFTDDFERLDGSASKFKRPVIPGSSMPHASQDRPHVYTNEPNDSYEMEEDDDDEEYMPPDAAAFDSTRMGQEGANKQQVTPHADDDSDYEPGEITVESINPSPRYQPQQALQPPSNVPVIRNHLTHLVAPQPNRVSPLTINNANMELELVNGRPEVVPKSSYQGHHVSRVSSASPAGYSGPGPSKARKKQKKRKRDNEPQGRNKRRQKQAESETPRSPVNQEPYIKDEPMSPPSFVPNVAPAPQYAYAQYSPAPIDLTGVRIAPSPQYAYEPQLRYQNVAPEPQQVIRMASPANRPVQRDTQDLRRAASLHHAKQRPLSPPISSYSPVAPYRTASTAYGDPRLQPREQVVAPTQNYYTVQQPPPPSQRLRSPAQSQRYDDSYSSRAASPALMPPPPQPAAQRARRIVQDQYGNRYYAADSAPTAPTTIRASAVPESYERATSRAAYTQPASSTYYEPADDSMPPPPPPRIQQTAGLEEPFEYTDADGYIVRGYRVRPADGSQSQHSQRPQYADPPALPAYQEYRPNEQLPPPSALQPPRQTQEPTSPTYNSNYSRSYSIHPEQSAPAPPSYLRQASVAPVQYVPLRQGSVAPTQYMSHSQAKSAAYAPPRAVSVAPRYEYGATQQQTAPRFVNQYGNPVYAMEVREVRQADDYYQS